MLNADKFTVSMLFSITDKKNLDISKVGGPIHNFIGQSRRHTFVTSAITGSSIQQTMAAGICYKWWLVSSRSLLQGHKSTVQHFIRQRRHAKEYSSVRFCFSLFCYLVACHFEFDFGSNFGHTLCYIRHCCLYTL